jgi:hemoglobin
MRHYGWSTLALVFTAALLVGCENMRKEKDDGDKATSAKKDAPTPRSDQHGTAQAGGMQAGKTLYDRLGGEPAIRAVVGDFVDASAADPKVNFTRKGTPKEWQATPESVQQLKQRLTEFVAQGAGGPVKYTGEDMRQVHTGMKITDGEFNAMAAHLKNAMQKHSVPQREQAELMAIVESTRKNVVGL